MLRKLFVPSLVIAFCMSMLGCEVGNNVQKDVVFIGDSHIAQNDWASFLGISSVSNQGIVGNTIADVHNRIEETIRLRPNIVILMVGINNKPTKDTVDQIIAEYKRLLIRLSRDLPKAKIYIHSLLPVHESLFHSNYPSVITNNSDIEIFNQSLKAVADQLNVNFVDVYPLLLESGQLNTKWTMDGLHLNRLGYIQWRPLLTAHLQPYIKKE